MNRKILTMVAVLLALLHSSCDPRKVFGVGSYPYAEPIKLSCPGDSVIKKLTQLKATGRYNHPQSFEDGFDEGKIWYDFYLFCPEINALLHLNVTPHTPRTSTILLIGVKIPVGAASWQEVNRDLPQQEEEKVLQWFNDFIKPKLACN